MVTRALVNQDQNIHDHDRDHGSCCLRCVSVNVVVVVASFFYSSLRCLLFFFLHAVHVSLVLVTTVPRFLMLLEATKQKMDTIVIHVYVLYFATLVGTMRTPAKRGTRYYE